MLMINVYESFLFQKFLGVPFRQLRNPNFYFLHSSGICKGWCSSRHGLSQAVKLSMKEKPANQLIGSLSCYLPGSLHPKWCRISSNRILGIDGCEWYQSWTMMPIQLMIALGLRIFVRCPQLPVIFSILNTTISLLRDDCPHPPKKNIEQLFLQLLSFLPEIPCINKETYQILGVSKNRGTPKWMVYKGKPY